MQTVQCLVLGLHRGRRRKCTTEQCRGVHPDAGSGLVSHSGSRRFEGALSSLLFLRMDCYVAVDAKKLRTGHLVSAAKDEEQLDPGFRRSSTRTLEERWIPQQVQTSPFQPDLTSPEVLSRSRRVIDRIQFHT